MNRAEPRGADQTRLLNILVEIVPKRSRIDLEAHWRGIAVAPAKFGDYAGLRLLAPRASDLQLAELARGTARAALAYAADVERPEAAATRLAALRQELRRRNLAGFIVPLTDQYHGEYVPKCAQRLTWLTGFTGSAGLAIVLLEHAGLWSDGRYTLQMREQVDAAFYTLHHITDDPPYDWLARTLKPGDRFGYDPWLHTLDGVARMKSACERAGAALVVLDDNPLDAAWVDRPPAPLAPVVAHDLRYAGQKSSEKRARLLHHLVTNQVDAAVLTLPESIAWLLNLRGGDVPHSPLPLSMALFHNTGRVDLFIDQRKLEPSLAEHLGPDVTIAPPDDFGLALDALGRAAKTVQVDPATAAAWLFARLDRSGAKVHRADDPCLLPKACKNPVELRGARAAHLRDGAAVSRFLAWLAEAAPAGVVDEIAAADKLASFRRQNELIQDLSFTTISGAGPNGAIVHYRVTPKTNRKLGLGELYLIDSGAQYLDGTTDITRTIAIGAPSPEMRDRFTRVLKGHIALAGARFPTGTSGQQLDVLARAPLWRVGLDYDHGTGHGVGSYLSVHEGPQRIAKTGGTVPLKPGMIVSNEPGYYKAGAYGIRIENLVAVIELPDAPGAPSMLGTQGVQGAPDVTMRAALPPGAERKFLGFETLTKVPIDLNLVEAALLAPEEIAWLDSYHAEVRAALAPLLDTASAVWLNRATRPVGSG